MFNVKALNVQQSLVRLGHLNVEIWYRTLLLSVSGLESFGQRLQRLQAQCEEKVLKSLLSLPSQQSGSGDGDSPEELIAACTDAYIEEIRNCEQVALITRDEMEVWLDAYFNEWRKLSEATFNYSP